MTCRACSVEGCQNPAATRMDVCWGHYKRRQRGKPVEEPLREYGLSYTERLLKVALEYADADADGDEEYKRKRAKLVRHYAQARFIKAKKQIVQQRPKTSPRR